MSKRYYRPLIFFLLFLPIVLLVFIYTNKFNTNKQVYSQTLNPPRAVRGVAGDLWADVEVGKRDFAEIAPREIVPFKVFSSGGVAVDRSVNPGKMYVWDSGNNRILGLDLGKCYSQESPCSADLVIGQPSPNDYGACNLDSSMQTYPDKPPATDAALCGIDPRTYTALEDKSFSNMFVDQNSGDLYAPDTKNHRVLKYTSPFTTDVIADEVWGQADFSGNLCNKGADTPAADTVCYETPFSGYLGVAMDSLGNLWIADGGNHRVLRFSKDQSSGIVAKTADLVLGQPDFVSYFGDCGGPTAPLTRMCSPANVRFDANGSLYVADTGNNRILVYDQPFSSNQTPTRLLSNNISGLMSIEMDTKARGIWVLENSGFNGTGNLKLLGFDGSLLVNLTDDKNLGMHGFSFPTGGSIGIDSEGNLLPSIFRFSNVYQISERPEGTFYLKKYLFAPPFGDNLTSGKRFESPAWTGVGVVGNQLVVVDGRVLFWNDLAALTNGQAPDGFVGGTTVADIPNPAFSQVKVDLDNRVWISKGDQVLVYQGPLTLGAAPINKIITPLNVLGGGQIDLTDVRGLAPTDHGEFLWIAQANKHHVLRVRNPLTSPQVDVVLGQTSIGGSLCNRGEVPAPIMDAARPPSQDAKLDMLCFPGALSLDKMGNLYVSDHTVEAEGNWRMLMFSASLFAPDNSQVLYAPAATKEFPRHNGSYNTFNHMTFEPAFDSFNRMVVGSNPYSGKRFVDYYLDPTKINAANPSDPNYASPDGQLNDFYGWPIAITFDKSDNLYVYDANRGQVRIYQTPLSSFVTPTPTPTPTINPTPIRVSLFPVADTFVRSDSPNSTSGGSNPKLKINGKPIYIAYLKFDLSSLLGKTIVSAKFRFRVANSSNSSQNFKFVSNNGWTEKSMTYKNRPALSELLSTFSGGKAEAWHEVDLTNSVSQKAGNAFTFAIDSDRSDDLVINSRESSYKPQLSIKYY